MLDRRALRTGRERRRPVRVVGAPPVAADQALGHQLLQRAGDLLRLGGGQVPHVQQVQVDPLGAQPAQRRPAGPADIAGRGVLAR